MKNKLEKALKGFVLVTIFCIVGLLINAYAGSMSSEGLAVIFILIFIVSFIVLLVYLVKYVLMLGDFIDKL